MKTLSGEAQIDGKFNALTSQGSMVKHPGYVIQIGDRRYGTFRFNDLYEGIPWKMGVTLNDIDDWKDDPPDKELIIWIAKEPRRIDKFELTLDAFFNPPEDADGDLRYFKTEEIRHGDA